MIYPATLQKLERTPSPDNIPPYFFIRHQGRHLKINLSDIRYIESRKNYCKIATGNGAFLVLITMKQLQAILPQDRFCRIHRAFIVSLDWISAFDRHLVYGTDWKLPIGEMGWHALKDRILVLGEGIRLTTETLD
jgi:DNA-binding LytR/AlgR family response regulator